MSRALFNVISSNASKRSSKRRELFTLVQPKSATAEAFRTLRTNIIFSSLKGSNKVILITSPSMEDGKTTVVANLAVVMAQAQNRVLIIDCDLRKPMIHKCFDKNKACGLTNLLVEDLEPEEVICATEVEGLHVITSGPVPPNPSELLGSAQMAGFISRMSEHYDVVLLDSPPVAAVTDAALLAPWADSVLLVVKAGKTRIEAAKEARDRLQNVGSRNIGVVLNEASLVDSGYRNYNYYYGSKGESAQ